MQTSEFVDKKLYGGWWGDSRSNNQLSFVFLASSSNLSWECWQHVGKMSVICRNVDEFGNFYVLVPTPKFPRHNIFVSKIADTVPHTRTYIRTKIQCPPQNSDTGN
jgi:hypothetical protein